MEKNHQGIYWIKNKINGKVRVGQACGKRGISNRFYQHRSALNKNEHYNPHLQNAWNKYGEPNFDFLVLELVADVAELDGREEYWITETWDYNYNIQKFPKSNLGLKRSEETKRKIGDANRRRVFTDEMRKNMGKAHKGKKKSAEFKENLRIKNTGKKHSEETKRKIGDVHRNKIVTEHTKNLIRNKAIGRTPSKEGIEKRKATIRKKPHYKSTTGYKGVSCHSSGNFRARIQTEDGSIFLGYFKNKEEAAKNYDFYAILFFGKENSFLNFAEFDYSNFTPKLNLNKEQPASEHTTAPLVDSENAVTV